MNPPPLPPATPSDLFSLPTIGLMVAITFLMQASAIWFNSRMVKEYRGITTAVYAASAQALSFIFILLLPFHVSMGLISNLFMLIGQALIYIAICRFIDKRFNRYLLYGLVPLGIISLLVMGIFHPIRFPLISITQFVGFPLNLAAALALFHADKQRYKLGAYLTALPLLVYGLITVIRFFTGILFPFEVAPGPTFSNIFDVLALYVLSYLWIAGFILMISQRLQSDLNDLAMNDALTRVRNRRAMQSMLDFEMRRVQTEVKDFSIILLDVDHFKRINDTYGHDVGDLVLHWMAQTLQSTLRVQDTVARWGGEEFLILLPDTNLEQATEIAERLRLLVEQTLIPNVPVPLHITFSGGVATSKDNRPVDALCKVADQALYIAKQTRNCITSQTEIPADEMIA